MVVQSQALRHLSQYEQVIGISIELSAERMKTGHYIGVNEAREKDPPGDEMAALDPVVEGRVQNLGRPPGNDAQAMAVLNEIRRLSGLIPNLSWVRAAISSGGMRRREPVRDFAEATGTRLEFANERLPRLWRMRETQAFVETFSGDQSRIASAHALSLDCPDL